MWASDVSIVSHYTCLTVLKIKYFLNNLKNGFDYFSIILQQIFGYQKFFNVLNIT